MEYAPLDEQAVFNRNKYITRESRETCEHIDKLLAEWKKLSEEAPEKRQQITDRFKKIILSTELRSEQHANSILLSELFSLIDSSPSLEDIDPSRLERALSKYLKTIGFIHEKRLQTSELITVDTAPREEVEARNQRLVRERIEAVHKARCLEIVGEEIPLPPTIEQLFPLPSPKEVVQKDDTVAA